MEVWRTATDGPEQTRRLGVELGRMTPAGLVILLDGELGSGKTCLVQGIAEGLGVPADEAVTSPTYTLMNQYRGRCDLFHFDLYRLVHPDELVDIDFEEIAAGTGLTVVEWAERVLESDRLGLHVALNHAGGDRRNLAFTARGPAARQVLAALARTAEEKETRS